jgi:integrase
MPGHVRARKDANGRVMKRKDGSTIWQARWRPADDASDRSREERNFKTKKEGERWIAQRDSDVLRGVYAPAKRGEVLVSALADELRGVWTAKGLEPKTRAGYEAILSRWLIGPSDPLDPGRPCRFARAKVAAVTTKTVQEFVKEVGAARAPNTARRIFGVLNSLMKLAAQRGYIAANPCDAVEMPSKKRAGVRRSRLYLEGHEVRALSLALPPHWRLAVLLDGSCGLRAGEVWALRHRDIDLLNRELTVWFALKEVNSRALDDSTKGLLVGHPKSAASRRTLSIPAGLVPLMETHLTTTGTGSGNGYAVVREDPSDENRGDLDWTNDPRDPDRLVFVTPTGYPVRHNLFYKRVFKPAVRAALPPRLHALRFHDLRHTAATLALGGGAPMAMVKERLGHENIATTVDLYGKRVPSVDAAIADAVGASIFAPEVAEVVPLRPAASA